MLAGAGKVACRHGHLEHALAQRRVGWIECRRFGQRVAGGGHVVARDLTVRQQQEEFASLHRLTLRDGQSRRMSQRVLVRRLDREDFLIGVEGRLELALEAPGVGNRRKAPGGAIDVARAQMQLREQQCSVEVTRLFVDETGIGLDGRRQLADPEKLFCGPESRLTVA